MNKRISKLAVKKAESLFKEGYNFPQVEEIISESFNDISSTKVCSIAVDHYRGQFVRR